MSSALTTTSPLAPAITRVVALCEPRYPAARPVRAFLSFFANACVTALSWATVSAWARVRSFRLSTAYSSTLTSVSRWARESFSRFLSSMNVKKTVIVRKNISDMAMVITNTWTFTLNRI